MIMIIQTRQEQIPYQIHPYHFRSIIKYSVHSFLPPQYKFQTVSFPYSFRALQIYIITVWSVKTAKLSTQPANSRPSSTLVHMWNNFYNLSPSLPFESCSSFMQAPFTICTLCTSLCVGQGAMCVIQTSLASQNRLLHLPLGQAQRVKGTFCVADPGNIAPWIWETILQGILLHSSFTSRQEHTTHSGRSDSSLESIRIFCLCVSPPAKPVTFLQIIFRRLSVKDAVKTRASSCEGMLVWTDHCSTK